LERYRRGQISKGELGRWGAIVLLMDDDYELPKEDTADWEFVCNTLHELAELPEPFVR
jgi:hypothetical protein